MTAIPVRYRTRVLDELARHGLLPGPTTPAALLRDAVRDLYRHEIRALRTALLAGRIRKVDYAGRVIELRGRYPLLSLPIEMWSEAEGAAEASASPPPGFGL